MSGKTWLEAALNGAWSRARQPGIPVTVEEIVADGIAAAEAGAAIVHLHAYDAASGRQKDDAALYAPIIEGIRAKADVIVYPTVTGAVPKGSEISVMGPERYAPVAELARLGLLEWAVVDPDTANFSSFEAIAEGRPGTIYMNPESDIRAGLGLAARDGIHPTYAIYEPGFLRLGAALAKSHAGLKTPIYRFMFSDGLTFGFPPRAYGLDAYLALKDEAAPAAPWMIAGLMVEVTPLIEETVACGGHVRTGLEDAPLGVEKSNRTLVAEAARAIERAAGRLATAAEVRAALALVPPAG